ncbi:cytochrome P450 [Nonomuraea fastidiosa]|uniref:cytochrome P450 n=1 Tax=Nonomuraea fastidiosa TaxID=46173 RepID=UPI00366AC064
MRKDDRVPSYPFTGPPGPRPAPDLAALRDAAPVARVSLPSGALAWLVTRHEENRRFLADPAFSRAAAVSGAGPRLRSRPQSPSLAAMDPPEHTRLRRLVTGAFSGGTVARLRSWLDEAADSLVRDMVAAGPPADVVASLARPLPFLAICRLLGVPVCDHARFHDWVTAHLDGTDDDALLGYLAGLVTAKRKEPGEDLLGELTGVLDDAELVALGSTLLVAGLQPPACMIAGSVQALLADPGQLAALRREPGLMDTAVEELLRYVPIAVSGGTMRVAVRATSLGGQRIEEGEAVLPSTVAANRDPRAFTDPDRLDLARTPNPHLAFGHGPHRCLGAHLARAELRAALAALLRHMPGLRPALPDDQVTWRTTGLLRGPEHLPVTW